jgi:hypothetical protein
MATEGPLGSFINEEGLRRSARFTKLETALQNNNQDAVIKIALEDASEALQSVGTGGSRRKMRGGTIDKALADAAEGLKNATKADLNKFNQAIEAFIRSTPDLYKNYSGVAAKGLALGTVLKYPMPFANIAAALIKLIPLPSGADWTVYNSALGTLVSALAEVGITISAEAIAGPVLIGLFALYVQNKRAEVNNISVGQVFLNDGKALVYALRTAAGSLSGLMQEQVDAFKKAFAKPTPSKFAVEDLKAIANNLQMEPTLELAGNIEGFQPVPDVVDEEGNQLLRPVTKKESGKKRKPALTSEQVEETGYTGDTGRQGQAKVARTDQTPSKTGSEGPSSAPSALMSPPPTASSSMTDAEMIVPASSSSTSTSTSGGRRRKTRKPKKIRRITRRFRRHFAY